jgi:hypothetical protein
MEWIEFFLELPLDGQIILSVLLLSIAGLLTWLVWP